MQQAQDLTEQPWFQEALRWKEHITDKELTQELDSLFEQAQYDSIEDAFFQDLSFGTAGLRGIIGVGTNRMNIYTVAKATAGLASYITTLTGSHLVVITRDSRLKGWEFSQIAACILASHGIKVALFDRIQPVPLLSFAVRALGASAGIAMTASHNPAAYNGYKVYGSDGCQITSDSAQAISTAIDSIDPFTVSYDSYESYVETGLIEFVDESILKAFLKETVSLRSSLVSDISNLSLVYTPLNGSGLELHERLFDALAIPSVDIVAEQRDPDGTFPTCPYPNPETREALERGIELLEKRGADLLLATDPDADRVGVAVRAKDSIALLTGNELGILLFDFLCRTRLAENRLYADSIVVSTIVSTDMIDALAAHYGVHVVRTLTGFKYIGSILNELEKADKADHYILGFEESYGYLATPLVRDKDSVSTSMYICQMASYWKSQGLTLVDALEMLYQAYGYYQNATISVAFEGAAGAHELTRIMNQLRSNPPREIAHLRIEALRDYEQGIDGLPLANVVELQLEYGAKVIIRPSGTEPKVKAYLYSFGSSRHDAQELLELLKQEAQKLLK